jgi:hypothetical protein
MRRLRRGMQVPLEARDAKGAVGLLREERFARSTQLQ